MTDKRMPHALSRAPKRRRALGGLAAVAAGLLIATSGAVASVAAPAAFPSWADVQAAKRDEASAKAQLATLNASITAAEAEVARTQQIADEAGAVYAEAQQAYDEQAIVTETIQAQEAQARTEADKAKGDSAQLIAGLARQGGTDITVGVIGDGGATDTYLYRLGTMQKVTEATSGVYERAIQLQNTAKSLADQAAIAQAKLDELKQDAESKFLVAQEAQDAAQVKYDELQEAKGKAEALVAYVVDKREVTEADYAEGERQRKAAEAAAAAAAGNGGGGGSGGGTPIGTISAAGWAKPSVGHVRSAYGMRVNPVTGVRMLHTGVDTAAPCAAGIYAAADGVVTYAGWFGTWGNYVKVDHADGVDTGYAHIMPGGILVHNGQQVSAGQLIAKVGTTGQSTGCHLHFIVRINDRTTDPVPFMRNKGITFG